MCSKYFVPRAIDRSVCLQWHLVDMWVNIVCFVSVRNLTFFRRGGKQYQIEKDSSRRFIVISTKKEEASICYVLSRARVRTHTHSHTQVTHTRKNTYFYAHAHSNTQAFIQACTPTLELSLSCKLNDDVSFLFVQLRISIGFQFFQ